MFSEPAVNRLPQRNSACCCWVGLPAEPRNGAGHGQRERRVRGPAVAEQQRRVPEKAVRVPLDCGTAQRARFLIQIGEGNLQPGVLAVWAAGVVFHPPLVWLQVGMLGPSGPGRMGEGEGQDGVGPLAQKLGEHLVVALMRVRAREGHVNADGPGVGFVQVVHQQGVEPPAPRPAPVVFQHRWRLETGVVQGDDDYILACQACQFRSGQLAEAPVVGCALQRHQRAREMQKAKQHGHSAAQQRGERSWMQLLELQPGHEGPCSVFGGSKALIVGEKPLAVKPAAGEALSALERCQVSTNQISTKAGLNKVVQPFPEYANLSGNVGLAASYR